MSERVRTRWAGPLVSLVIHGVILTVLFFVSPPKREPPGARAVVKVNIAKPPAPKAPEPAVEKEPEPPKPPPEVAPEPKVVEAPKPPPPQEKKKPPRKPKKKVVKKAPEPPPAPPVETTPPPPAPKPTKKFSYELPSGPGGSVALPSGPGGSRVGDVDGDEDGVIGQDFKDRGREPVETRDEPEVVEVTEVTTRPRLIGRPSDRELRAAYPEEARRAGVEADVKLRVLVDERGEVAQVKVVGTAGRGFDEAARELARKLRFEPARRGGKPVRVWVTFPFKFRLDD